ncbi:lymphotoxin-alpha-like [Pagrus major]|uniref:lymphotoxin-alpha-like n=1 Tax=Pagrus major TaxID=143350 RepID=UPI003CC87748
MEMADGSRRLIRAWETSGMEGHGCCCGGEASSHRQDTLIQFLRQKETRLQRMVQFLAVGLLLLISLAVGLLITAVHGGRGAQPPNRQPSLQSVSNSSGTSVNQQQHDDLKHPSALLTVPRGDNFDGKYLEWESKDGQAFCVGGFNYSSGNLVVPRNGYYRVFLQITYQSKEDLMCDRRTLSSTVFVFRDAYPQDRPLLSSADTVGCDMEPWTKSLYTSGVFHLEVNCRLRVTSSFRDLIVKEEHQVFFGAELLPQ